MTELAGRRALVTGGARGLGRGIAELFVEQGARVAISDVDELAATQTAKDIGAVASVQCDVTSEPAVRAATATVTEQLGGLDVLVNNAGIEIVKPLFDQTADELDQIMAVNVRGVFLGMQHALPHLAATRGAIVNMASIAGLGGAPLFGTYCASKAAVIQLTRTAAVELRETGIRVNAVCPGFADTAMVERLAPTVSSAVGADFDQLVQQKQGRLGTAREVAETVSFLASDRASWTTGAHYVLDGGLTASLL